MVVDATGILCAIRSWLVRKVVAPKNIYKAFGPNPFPSTLGVRTLFAMFWSTSVYFTVLFLEMGYLCYARF
jgi:hypothetical protein